MNLLLLLYAMIAGLAGINAGPAAMSRTAAVAQGGSVAGEIDAAPAQSGIAERALHAMSYAVRVLPAVTQVDARRIAVAAPSMVLPVSGRAAPERRLE